MAKRQLPSPEVLRQLLRYEPDTGKLFWKGRGVEWFADGGHTAAHTCAKWNARFAGVEALCHRAPNGYLYGHVLGAKVVSHRAIWAICTGSWPEADIDHINGVRDCNLFENLRDVSRSTNLRNMKKSIRNTSGHTGVYWNKDCSKWEAKIRHGGRQEHLGLFTSIDDAIAARAAAERQHGYHPSHGKR